MRSQSVTQSETQGDRPARTGTRETQEQGPQPNTQHNLACIAVCSWELGCRPTRETARMSPMGRSSTASYCMVEHSRSKCSGGHGPEWLCAVNSPHVLPAALCCLATSSLINSNHIQRSCPPRMCPFRRWDQMSPRPDLSSSPCSQSQQTSVTTKWEWSYVYSHALIMIQKAAKLYVPGHIYVLPSYSLS